MTITMETVRFIDREYGWNFIKDYSREENEKRCKELLAKIDEEQAELLECILGTDFVLVAEDHITPHRFVELLEGVMSYNLLVCEDEAIECLDAWFIATGTSTFYALYRGAHSTKELINPDFVKSLIHNETFMLMSYAFKAASMTNIVRILRLQKDLLNVSFEFDKFTKDVIFRRLVSENTHSDMLCCNSNLRNLYTIFPEYEKLVKVFYVLYWKTRDVYLYEYLTTTAMRESIDEVCQICDLSVYEAVGSIDYVYWMLSSWGEYQSFYNIGDKLIYLTKEDVEIEDIIDFLYFEWELYAEFEKENEKVLNYFIDRYGYKDKEREICDLFQEAEEDSGGARANSFYMETDDFDEIDYLPTAISGRPSSNERKPVMKEEVGEYVSLTVSLCGKLNGNLVAYRTFENGKVYKSQKVYVDVINVGGLESDYFLNDLKVHIYGKVINHKGKSPIVLVSSYEFVLDDLVCEDFPHDFSKVEVGKIYRVVGELQTSCYNIREIMLENGYGLRILNRENAANRLMKIEDDIEVECYVVVQKINRNQIICGTIYATYKFGWDSTKKVML